MAMLLENLSTLIGYAATGYAIPALGGRLLDGRVGDRQRYARTLV